ncbi:MAG: PD-(D/E)XK nuclease family protein [Deltaproteobacteria bacterium]|nr:PD-(D/E)XK nuclease family protein [Deltaproteobacteria bacterium]
MRTFILPAIPATSPTLAETMRLCQLRASISKIPGSSAFVLGNPKVWLGTAYHEVLERILEVDFSRESVDNAIERLWSSVVTARHHRSTLHPLDRRFGLPETWPGYHIARASVFLRARELVTEAGGERRATSPPNGIAMGDEGFGHSIRERQFSAFDGRLVGKPDVIRAREIVDYKAVEGILTEPPRRIHAGAAVALAVESRAGSETPRSLQIAPFNPSAHSSVTTVTIGDRVRIVGLRVRPDGVLAPTQRTVIARVADLPEIG